MWTGPFVCAYRYVVSNSSDAISPWEAASSQVFWRFAIGLAIFAAIFFASWVTTSELLGHAGMLASAIIFLFGFAGALVAFAHIASFGLGRTLR